MNNNYKGKFNAIESFSIKRRGEFYILGQLIDGKVRRGSKIKIMFNKSLGITLEITDVEEVEISGEKGEFLLLIASGESDELDLLLDMKIGNETLEII